MKDVQAPPAIVAIDGPAGAGKSSISRRIAERLGFTYIDTGAMYRCVALAAQQSGIDMDDPAALEALADRTRISFGSSNTVLLNGRDVTAEIRTPSASSAASKVSAIPGVRRAMVREQRRIAEGTSVVMEGRDIGSVVFPNADVKIYLDADPRVRAERRAAELEDRGIPADVSDIERGIRERDHRDATRKDSPMIQAPDAILVDSSSLTLEQVEEALLTVIQAKLGTNQTILRKGSPS